MVSGSASTPRTTVDLALDGQALGRAAGVRAHLGRLLDAAGKLLGLDLEGDRAAATGRDLLVVVDRRTAAGRLDLFDTQNRSAGVLDPEGVRDDLALQHGPPVVDRLRDLDRRRLERERWGSQAVATGRLWRRLCRDDGFRRGNLRREALRRGLPLVLGERDAAEKEQAECQTADRGVRQTGFRAVWVSHDDPWRIRFRWGEAIGFSQDAVFTG